MDVAVATRSAIDGLLARLRAPTESRLLIGSSLVYVAMRALAFGHGVESWPGTANYIRQAGLPVLSERFLAGRLPFTVPLVWKILPGSSQVIVLAQVAISVACWLYLAATVASVAERRAARLIGFWGVLCLSLATWVTQWDNALTSESLALSLTALVLGLGLRLVHRPRRITLGATLMVAALWAFARDSNAYAALAAIPALLVVVVLRSRERRLTVVALLGALAIFSGSVISASAGNRAGPQVEGVIGFRLSHTGPAALDWLRAHGSRNESGTSVVAAYRSYLIHHPRSALLGPLENGATDAPGSTQLRHFALYTPDVRRYDRGEALWRLPGPLQSALHPMRPHLLAFALVLVLLGAAVAMWKGRGGAVLFASVLAIAAVYPQIVVVWNGSGTEVDRHALVPAVTLQLMVFVLGVLVSERLYALARSAGFTLRWEAASATAAAGHRKVLGVRRSAGLRSIAAWAARDGNRFFAIALAIGVALRLVITFGSLGQINSDEGVIYLAARHVTHGEFHTYFWGQGYGGTLLQSVLGGIFVVARPHVWMLTALNTLLAAAIPVVFRAVGARIWNHKVGNVAASIAAIAPASFLYFGVHDPGYLNFGLLSSLAAVLALLVFRERGQTRYVIAAGLAAGIGLWETPFTLLFTLPVVTAFLLLRPVNRAAIFLVSAALGAVPAIVAFVADKPTVVGGAPFHDDFLTRTAQAATTLFSAGIIGLRFRTGDQIGFAARCLLGVAVFGAVLVAGVVYARRRQLSQLLVCASVLAWPFFVARAGLLTDQSAARYVSVLVPPLALLAAAAFVRWRIATPGLVLALATTMVAVHAGHGFSRTTASTRSDPLLEGYDSSFRPLASFLERHQRTHIWADYWLSYKLAAESNERITADPLRPSRYPSYRRLAEAAPRATVVAFSQLRVNRVLAGLGARTVHIAGYTVYLFDRRLTAAELKALA